MPKKTTKKSISGFRECQSRFLADIKTGNYKPLNEYIITARGMIEDGLVVGDSLFNDKYYFEFFGIDTEYYGQQASTILQRQGMEYAPGLDCCYPQKALLSWIKNIINAVVESEVIKYGITLNPSFKLKCVRTIISYVQGKADIEQLEDVLSEYNFALKNQEVKKAVEEAEKTNTEPASQQESEPKKTDDVTDNDFWKHYTPATYREVEKRTRISRSTLTDKWKDEIFTDGKPVCKKYKNKSYWHSRWLAQHTKS